MEACIYRTKCSGRHQSVLRLIQSLILILIVFLNNKGDCLSGSPLKLMQSKELFPQRIEY